MLPSNNSGFPAPSYQDSVVATRSAGGVQAAMQNVLASVQGGVQKVQVPCTFCTDGSIISGAGECRECRHTSGLSDLKF